MSINAVPFVTVHSFLPGQLTAPPPQGTPVETLAATKAFKSAL